MINTTAIEVFMKKNGLSKTKFCKLCKISLTTFQKIMGQDFNFCMTALFKIARVIGIPVFQMFK